jgi:hypothetical protein
VLIAVIDSIAQLLLYLMLCALIENSITVAFHTVFSPLNDDAYHAIA